MRATVEAWVLAFDRKGIDRLEPRHVIEVAGLVDQLGPEPIIRDRDLQRQRNRRAAFRAERLELARSAIRWCPSPERLGRWLVRALTWFRVENLGAYLRRSCDHGDPGTLLDSHAKNRLGRGAETWRDFSAAAERELEGKHAADVEKLVAGGVAVLGNADEDQREALRAQLRELLAGGRRDAARVVLLRLLPHDHPNDDELQMAIGDALPLPEARRLLAA